MIDKTASVSPAECGETMVGSVVADLQVEIARGRRIITSSTSLTMSLLRGIYTAAPFLDPG
jgi:hypothetical protein